jgi:hypothetical protein
MQIYLDCHGVLADLMAGLIKRYKLRYVDYPPGEYDITRILKREVPWATYSAEWWSNLPRTSEASALVELGYHYASKGADGRHNLTVVSAPCSADCAAGTYAWVAGNYPLKTILMDDKHLLAGPGRVLIDDKDSNIDAWIDAGGIGILVPRPWNSAYHVADVVAHVEHCLLRV